MSRVIVKKIGKNVDEKQLKELFERKGEVTDVKVARTTDGRSRGFAFVGFRTEQQAQDAQRYYDNTFIGLSRIGVEIARRLNDTELLERKQKFAKPSQLKVKELQERVKEIDSKSLPKSKQETKKEKLRQQQQQQQAVEKSEKKNEFIELVTGKEQKVIVPKGMTDVVEDAESDEEMENDVVVDREEEEDSQATGSVDEDDESAVDWEDLQVSTTTAAATKKPLSDLDYLRSKVTKRVGDSDSESDHEDSDKDEDNDEEAEADEEDEDQVDTAPTDEPAHVDDQEEEQEQEQDESRIFIKNLPFTCTEDELRTLCEVYGTITEVHIPLNADKRSKGIAFVTFLFPEHADKAVAELHGSAFQGRVIYLSKALKQPPPLTPEEVMMMSDLHGKKLSTFQLKKEEERRKAAQKREGWNASFVRSDAVVDTLANQFGVSQAQIMDTSLTGGDIAVRLAIGESQVIQENKDFFLSHGVDLNALESLNSSDRKQSRDRSTTTLLIKNLPSDTVADEVESMFVRFGELHSFLLPPSKTVALVDFVHPSEARAAFKGLAYRRYKNSPLYVEWAPLKVIVDPAKAQAGSAAQKQQAKEQQQQQQQQQQQREGADSTAEDNMEDFSSLFIKNLNFVTTEDGLRAHCQRLGVTGLRTVVIQKKFKGTVVLSQGFGFAEFVNAQHATDALNRLNQSTLDSHKLEVKPSDKRLTTAPATAIKSASNNQQSSKLVVRNLAFQATKHELRSLFAAFGTVKTVRIPKKMGGQHRGFAFVDFATAQEAANAKLALASTHLYGRHLVIEWAKADEDDGEDGEDDGHGGKKISTITTLASKSAEASRKRALGDAKVLQAVQRGKRQRSGAGGEDDVDPEMKDLI